MLFLAKGVEGKICPEADPFSIGFTAVFMLFVVCDLCVSFPPLNTQIISLFLHIFAHSHKLPWALRHPLPKELEIPMFRKRSLLQIGCSGGKKSRSWETQPLLGYACYFRKVNRWRIPVLWHVHFLQELRWFSTLGSGNGDHRQYNKKHLRFAAFLAPVSQFLAS